MTVKQFLTVANLIESMQQRRHIVPIKVVQKFVVLTDFLIRTTRDLQHHSTLFAVLPVHKGEFRPVSATVRIGAVVCSSPRASCFPSHCFCVVSNRKRRTSVGGNRENPEKVHRREVERDVVVVQEAHIFETQCRLGAARGLRDCVGVSSRVATELRPYQRQEDAKVSTRPLKLPPVQGVAGAAHREQPLHVHVVYLPYRAVRPNNWR